MEIEVDADGEIINEFNAYGYDSYGIYNNGEGYRENNLPGNISVNIKLIR